MASVRRVLGAAVAGLVLASGCAQRASDPILSAKGDCANTDLTLRAGPTQQSWTRAIGQERVFVTSDRDCALTATAVLQTQQADGKWRAVPTEPFAGFEAPATPATRLGPGRPEAMYSVAWHFNPHDFAGGGPPACTARPLRLELLGLAAAVGPWCDDPAAGLRGPVYNTLAHAG